MTVFTEVWNSDYEIAPASGALVSQTGAQGLRASKVNIRERMEVEHYWSEEGGQDGVHKFPKGTTAQRTLTPYQGQLYWNSTVAALQYYDGMAWQNSNFASGVTMLFQGTSVPDGWALNASHNDKVVRIVSSASDGSAGSWTITGIDTYAGENISAAFNSGDAISTTPGEPDGGFTAGGQHRHSTTVSFTGVGNHTHAFNGAWRPPYVNFFICTKL